MNLAFRLLVACFVITAPTLLFLGLWRGLQRLRDDALLKSLAERSDAPPDVSTTAARALEKPPIRSDGTGPTFDSVTCSSCGESNMLGAKYCGSCLDELH